MIPAALQTYMRRALERLAAAGRPLTVSETFDGGPNRMPDMISAGWARHTGMDSTGRWALYGLTTEGRAALGPMHGGGGQ